MKRLYCILCVLLLLTGCASHRLVLPDFQENIRIFQGHSQVQLNFQGLMNRLGEADVVFVGEIHTDSMTHVFERILLEGLHRRHGRIAVSMEMFERDVQAVLNDYLAGRIPEEEFLKRSRPWKNYRNGYRPLVEYAKACGLPVLAANVPGRHARIAAMGGLEAIAAVPDSEKVWLPREIKPLDDEYKAQFMEQMKNRPPSPMAQLDPERMYLAQALRDDAMAEAIFDFLKFNPGYRMVSYEGDFHSAFRLGMVKKLLILNPNLRCVVISTIPVEDIRSASWDEVRGRGDYLIFVPKSGE